MHLRCRSFVRIDSYKPDSRFCWIQRVCRLARPQAAAAVTWIRAASSRDFSASRRACTSGRKRFNSSRLPRYVIDSFSHASAASAFSGMRRKHSAARRSWQRKSEKSCRRTAEELFRSGRRRVSAERRFSFTPRKVSSASGGIILGSPCAAHQSRLRRRYEKPRARRP